MVCGWFGWVVWEMWGGVSGVCMVWMGGEEVCGGDEWYVDGLDWIGTKCGRCVEG